MSTVWIARRKVELITIAIFPAKGSFCEIHQAYSMPRAVVGWSSWEKSLGYVVDGFGMPDDDELGALDQFCNSNSMHQIAENCTCTNLLHMNSAVEQVVKPQDWA